MWLLLKVCLRWFICKKFESNDFCALELSDKFCVPVGILLIKEGMFSTSDSVSLSSSSSASGRSREDGGRQSDDGSGGPTVRTGRILIETVTEVREDPLEEIVESSWPAKAGYEWVASDIQNQYSLFTWSRLLKSWLNCTPIVGRDVSRDIVSLERVSAVECVCHSQEGAIENFFYMYMCHFSQLHVRLPFDDFIMGILRLLNVAPTQLHSNSWVYCKLFVFSTACCTCNPLRSHFCISMIQGRDIRQRGYHW